MTDMAKVQELLKFTSADLPYNRRGERSPAQKKAWHDAEQGCARNLLQIFAVAAVLTVLGAVFISGEGRISVLIGGGIVGVLALGGYVLQNVFMRTPTVLIDDVESISGEARLNVDRGNDGARHYIMMLDKVDFTVSPDLYEVLEHGARYTAHYRKLGRTHLLLSLEQA